MQWSTWRAGRLLPGSGASLSLKRSLSTLRVGSLIVSILVPVTSFAPPETELSTLLSKEHTPPRHFLFAAHEKAMQSSSPSHSAAQDS